MNNNEMLDTLLDAAQAQQISVQRVEQASVEMSQMLNERLSELEQADATLTSAATQACLNVFAQKCADVFNDQAKQFQDTNNSIRDLTRELQKTKEDLDRAKRNSLLVYVLSAFTLLVSAVYVWWSTSVVRDALKAVQESFDSVNALAQQAAEQMDIVLNPVTVTSPGIAEIMYNIGTGIAVVVGAMFIFALIMFLKNS